MSTEAAAVARKAAEIIQQRGKATGRGIDDAGRVCYVGALTVAGGSAYLAAMLRHAWDILDEEGEPFGVIAWSDRDTTTATDVAKLLLRVADRLDFGGAS